MSTDIKVLIVDDSSIVRQVLKRELDKQPGITVIGVAPDPYVARDKIVSLRPDVLTLDIEMPRMDGLTFLRKLMKYHPVPTVIVSSLTAKGCDTAIACLEAGAVDVVSKPNESYSVGDLATELSQILRGAAKARLDVPPASPTPPSTPRSTATRAMIATTDKVVALGSSTGGTEALRVVLQALPRQSPGIVITQHMPEGFTKSFAERLDSLCEIEVREAQDGDRVVPGRALLAPGNKHMKLKRDGARYIVGVCDGPRVCRHRPSVEVLFETTAHFAGRNAMGVIMTGMGGDGAHGLLSLRKAGGFTVAQDEKSCVVFGMPAEAIKLGAACRVMSLDQIAGQIIEFATRRVAKSTAAA